MLNLLMAANTEYSGSITLDGIEIRDIAPESLYDIISVIQQNVFVFNASIKDNVFMFRSFDNAELNDAIRRAHFGELIAEHGENYLCGENGSALSGGEKQRVSIARSLLKNPLYCLRTRPPPRLTRRRRIRSRAIYLTWTE